MVNYQKLYAILVGAIDEALDSLEKLPEAAETMEALKAALLKTEEIYILESK